MMIMVTCTWKSANCCLFTFCIFVLSVLFWTNQRFNEVIMNLKGSDTTSSLLMKNMSLFAPVSDNKQSELNRILLENNCTTKFRRKHLMTVNLRARTGNRLFQLAALIATAASLCYTPVVHLENVTHLEEMFDLFNVKRIELNTSSFQAVSEPAAAIYDVNLTSRIDPAYNWTLLGFRQSFRYFDKYKDLIRSSFRIKEKIRRDVQNYISSFFKGQITVGIHVRRGDYVSENARKFGFSVSNVDYVSRAIVYIRQRFGKARYAFIVVSDGIKWCKKNIKGNDIHFSPFHEVGKDLYLLTQCQHNIVTSGTFGWMGAWLNESGVVVYDKSYPPPNTTFGRMLIKDDFYPKHWIGL